MTAGHPLQPGVCGDCGTPLDSARKTYCGDCKRLRRKDGNGRADQKRRQRDRDLRLAAAAAAVPPPPPTAPPGDAAGAGATPGGGRLDAGEQEAVTRAFADLYAAVLQHTEAQETLREATLAARDRDPEAVRRHQDAHRRMQKVLVATSDAAEAVVRRLEGGEAARLLPSGRPPLPRLARARGGPSR